MLHKVENIHVEVMMRYWVSGSISLNEEIIVTQGC